MDIDRNLIKRFLLEDLKNSINQNFISVVIGARQTGKTTLFQQIKDIIISEGNSSSYIFFFSFDDPQLRSKVKDNYNYLKEEIEKSLGISLTNLQNRIFIFIDEAQKLPEVFELVKILFDKFGEKIKIFISGSSSLEIHKKTAETLAGRVRFFYLYPLIFSEIIENRLYELSESVIECIFSKELSMSLLNELQSVIYRDRDSVRNIWNSSLLFGSLPRVFIENDISEKLFYIRDFIATYIEKDIRSLSQVGDIEIFTKVLSAIALHNGKLLNITGLSEELDIRRETLKKYINILKATFVIHLLPPYLKRDKARLRKNNKVFFFDAGVVNFLNKIESFEQIERNEFKPSIIETIIFQNILAKTKNLPFPPSFYFWRDYSEHEIDLIAEKGERIIPIEITISKDIKSNKLRNFSFFFNMYPDIKNGILLYGGDDVKEIAANGHTIFAIPLWLWW